jgi:hypothetical protein
MPNNITNVIVFNNMSKQRFDELQDKIRVDSGFGEELDKSIPSIDFNKLIPMPEDLNIDSGSIADRAICAFLSVINPDNNTITNPDYLVLRDMYKCESPYSFARLIANIQKTQKIITIFPESICKSEHELKASDVALGKRYFDNMSKYGHMTWYSWCCANWGTKWNSYNYQYYAENNIKPKFIPEDTNYIIFDTAWHSVPFILHVLAKMIPDVTLDYWYADEDTGCNTGHLVFEGDKVTLEDIPENCSKKAYEMCASIRCFDLQSHGYIFNEKKGTYVFDDSYVEE